MFKKEDFENRFEQTENVEIILPSGDLVRKDVTFTISWDTIRTILVHIEDIIQNNPKE